MHKRSLVKPSFILAGILATFISTIAWAADPAQTLSPKVGFIPAPLKPSVMPPEGPSVLAGRSCQQTDAEDAGDVKILYQPVREGGFRITGSDRPLVRNIVQGQNMIITGDVPLFKMASVQTIPLWKSKADGKPAPFTDFRKGSLGTLRLGVVGKDTKPLWLDTLAKSTTTTYSPGYTDYRVVSPDGDWTASVRIAPTLGMHGLVCRLEFDRDVPLIWHYGEVALVDPKSAPCDVTISGKEARLVDPQHPNSLVMAGWDGEGTGEKTADGRAAQFSSTKAGRLYHIAAVWGFTEIDNKIVEQARKNLMATQVAGEWPQEIEKIWQAWQECYIVPASNPEKHFRALMASPAGALQRTVEAWDARRQEFQVRTPDERFDAVMNWTRAMSDYLRQGPGLVISVDMPWHYHLDGNGWLGKQWAGDHATVGQMLRHYATGQHKPGKPDPFRTWGGELVAGRGGAIGAVSWDFNTGLPENNTPWWVDQVWQHYRWTGDRQFVRDLWPAVRRAVAFECKNHDVDGDGLFFTFYQHWESDSYASLGKSAIATATGWMMLDAAARLGVVAGDSQGAAEYRAMADKTRAAVDRELWNEKEGILNSVGSDGLRAHPYCWEVAWGVIGGLLDPARGRRAMSWVESRYGIEGRRPDVRMVVACDWWPLRWSNQFVCTEGMQHNVLAGMKCGDVDLWWPYAKTATDSAFRGPGGGLKMCFNSNGMTQSLIDTEYGVDNQLHMGVRGLFGIEPAIHEGRIDICPAFPKDWTEASIKTPDLSYEYRREGDKATFRIRTPQPLVKHVRASLSGPEVVTPAETESVVTVAVGPALSDQPRPAYPPTILANRQPVPSPARLTDEERERLRLVDLSGAYNIRAEELMTTPMRFDNRQSLMPAKDWWRNPSLTMKGTPRLIEIKQGVKFLTAGRPEGVAPDAAPKSLVALSSWKPYPWPAGVSIPVGRHCERLWLLLQNYVHPSKCYVPNGEVLFRYKGGETKIVSLVPPYNLDCFYQYFSREGEAVPLGQFDQWPAKGYSPGSMPSVRKLTFCHATALELQADSNRVLESIELRATCSEGILGLAGMTLLETNK